MLDQVICVILLTSVDPSNKYWQIVPQLDHRWCTNCLFYFFFVSTRINHKLRIFHTKEPNLKTLALRVPHGTRILQESENKDLQWILKSFALKHLYIVPAFCSPDLIICVYHKSGLEYVTNGLLLTSMLKILNYPFLKWVHYLPNHRKIHKHIRKISKSCETLQNMRKTSHDHISKGSIS